MRHIPYATSGFVAFALLLTLLAPHAPSATFNCNNNNCFADQIWYGNSPGAGVQFTVDKPYFADTNAFYNKYLFLTGNTGSQKAVIGVARTQGNGFPSNSNYCGGSSSGIAWNYFVYTWDSGGINVAARCYPVPSGDTNHLTYITAVGAECDGGSLKDDLSIHIQGFSSNYSDCVEAEIGTYNSIDDRMQWYGTVNDHMVWGGHWYNSDWVNSNYQLVGQTRLPDSSVQHLPPQQYWNTNPSLSYPGGDLWSCVYASGTTCIQGG